MGSILLWKNCIYIYRSALVLFLIQTPICTEHVYEVLGDADKTGQIIVFIIVDCIRNLLLEEELSNCCL